MRYELARALARTERAQFVVEALDMEAATDIPGAEWEPFQVAHLNDDGLFRHEIKSRQVGWSWTIAAEAWAVCQLYPRSTALFVSINREESAEKIRYVKQIHEAAYPPFRRSVLGDSITSQVYDNGSRVLSMPQRPLRGKPRAWVYLDEFAHYRLDREIYTAAVPVTTRGGRLRIGSSALGARGMFYEIGEQTQRSYPGYTRVRTPWWKVAGLIRAGMTLREVSRLCAEIGDRAGGTEEMVVRFGNERIQDIFANMPLDDFEQEYLCRYVDEASAYIAWADIMACTYHDEGTAEFYRLSHTPEDALSAIDELVDAVATGRIRGPLIWGLDIGRKRDLTELVLAEIVGGTHHVRAVLSLNRQAFETQALICRQLLDRLPVLRGYMDQNGLGMQLAETLHLLEGYNERAMPMIFTMPTKTLMATHLKTRFQRGARRASTGGIRIPNDRDLTYQIHSIRRRVTANSNVVFDVEQSERHHADKFWALALCNEAGETLERIASYPAAPTLTLRTTQRLDALVPGPSEPDLGDQVIGFGLTLEQYNTLIREGIPGLLAAGAAAAEMARAEQQAAQTVEGSLVDVDVDADAAGEAPPPQRRIDASLLQEVP